MWPACMPLAAITPCCINAYCIHIRGHSHMTSILWKGGRKKTVDFAYFQCINRFRTHRWGARKISTFCRRHMSIAPYSSLFLSLSHSWSLTYESRRRLSSTDARIHSIFRHQRVTEVDGVSTGKCLSIMYLCSHRDGRWLILIFGWSRVSKRDPYMLQLGEMFPYLSLG